MENKVTNAMIGQEIESILTVGFSDCENGITEYCMDTSKFYIKYKDEFVCIAATESFSKLELTVQKEISYDYEIDEDMGYAFGEVDNILLKQGEAATVFIRKVCFYNLIDENKETIVCDAMLLYLSTEQVLFFDPAYYFGINVGDEKLVDIWEEQHRKYEVQIVQ